MNTILRIAAVLALAVSVSAATVAGQTSNQQPTPESVEQARRRAREEAERAREAAERAREAAREVREQEAALRRARGRGAADGDRGRGPEFTENFSRTIRIGRTGTLDLSNISGDITVTGGGGDDLRIDAVKRVRRPTEAEARTLLQEIQIQVNERSNYVEVRTRYPRNRRNWSGGVDYTVAVPSGSTVTLNSVSGDVRVTNIRGDLRVGSVSGNVVLTTIGRLQSARTVSGDVQATEVEGQDLSLGTVSGDIAARNVKARSIEAELVSGDIGLTNVEVERLIARTISGDIDYNGRLVRNGRYQLQSQSGDIHLVPSNDTGFDLDASSFSGNVRSDFTFRNGATVQRARRGPSNQRLRGTVGDASALLTLRSFSGSVAVTRP